MITVLIFTCNAGPNFAELLDGLQAQTVKPAQIIVLDSQSTDQTPELAASRDCKVITIDRAEFDHGTTRNLGVGQTSTEFVVLLTHDAIPANTDMIAELIKPMQADPNIAICYGRQLPRPGAGALERFAREFNYPAKSARKTKNDIKTLGLKTFFCSDSCSAIRRSVFDQLGGFKNNVIANEDMLYAAKAISEGYAIHYCAEAKVYHSHPFNLAQTFKRFFNIGRFFADNQWLLKQTSIRHYGSSMIKTGIKTFWQKRKPLCIIALGIEFIVKAAACKIGWYYHMLSRKKR